MTAALMVVEAVAIALLALLVAGLLRSHAGILRALHDLGAGIGEPGAHRAQGAAPGEVPVAAAGAAPNRGLDEPAFDVQGVSPWDEAVAVGVVGARHRTILAFLSSGCLTCHGFWEAFDGPPDRRLPRDARIVIVTKGPEAESIARVRKLAPREVPVVMSEAAWDDYQVPVAPYFVLVDGPAGRVVGGGAAGTWDHVVRLLTESLDDETTPGGGSRRRRRPGS
jgi:hypothetical protein